MTVDVLRDRYLQYIQCLNERRIADLDEFVHEQLSYNDQSWTRSDYQNLLSDDFEAIPDLHFHIHQLAVDRSLVACRLVFECTPSREWQGLTPNGLTIRFAEHVFYRFRDGKIAQVWSLLDRPAIESQLAPRSPN